MTPKSDVEKQIDEAYDRRGHVTIRLKDGESLLGFVYNREYSNPRLKEDRFIDVMVKDSDRTRRIRMDDVASIEMSGKDYAESFEEGIKRTQEKKD